MKTIMLTIVLAMLTMTACVPPKVIPAKGYCIRYELSWPVAALPTVQKCVCEEDVYTGLVAVMDTFISQPEQIIITGVVLPNDCGAKPEAVNKTDEGIKNLLTQ